jgi:small subunit ribosomal protein S16
MPVKLRLQRHGKKGKPFYWIVAADSRAVRDGKFLEKIGTYNPIANPAIIDIDVDAAVQWLEKGAQPTDTTRAILSYKGVLFKKHLIGGVKKGAFTQEEAEKKFVAWLEEKATKIDQKKAKLAKAKADEKTKLLEAEKALNEEKLVAAKAAEEAAILAESEAKQAAKAAEEAAAQTEEAKPETIDDAMAAAQEETQE